MVRMVYSLQVYDVCDRTGASLLSSRHASVSALRLGQAWNSWRDAAGLSRLEHLESSTACQELMLRTWPAT